MAAPQKASPARGPAKPQAQAARPPAKAAAQANGGASFEDGGEDSFQVDLSGVTEQGEFEALPRGTYPVTIYDLEYGRSQRSNNPMWTMQLEVESGEYKGRRLFYHLVFNEGGLPRVKRTLARLGQTELLEGAFNPAKVAEEGSLVGMRCRARVNVRKYEGQDRNDVRDLLPAEAGDAFLGD